MRACTAAHLLVERLNKSDSETSVESGLALQSLNRPLELFDRALELVNLSQGVQVTQQTPIKKHHEQSPLPR